MNKFKVGDRVKLVKMKGEGPWYKKYLGNVYTIKNFETDNYGRFAIFKETSDVMPYVKNLKLVKEEYTYEDLKKCPVGTKVTFENEKTFFKIANSLLGDGYKYQIVNPSSFNSVLNGKIIKIEEPTYETVYEAKPEILDEIEKRYLKAVVRPFRDKVDYIAKKKSKVINDEFIYIHLPHNLSINFPYFKPNTMYKGMKTDKQYTLEELGL